MIVVWGVRAVPTGHGLGIFGAWVYYWQQAAGFWEHLYAIFQGLFWPAYMVYEAFSKLAA